MNFIYITESNLSKKVANSIQSVEMEKAFRNLFSNFHSFFSGKKFKEYEKMTIFPVKQNSFLSKKLYPLKVIYYCLTNRLLKNRNNYIYCRSTVIAFLFVIIGYENVMLELHELNTKHLFLLNLIKNSKLKFFPISSHMKNDLVKENFKLKHIKVLPDAHSFGIREKKIGLIEYEKFKSKDRKVKIGYFGSLYERKGFTLLKEILCKYGDAYEFYIYTKDQEKVIDLKCKTKYLSHDSVYNKMLEVDILLFVYNVGMFNYSQQTSPLKIYEYLSTLKPILYISIGDLKNELKDTLSLPFKGIDDFVSVLGSFKKIENPKRLINNSYKLAAKRTFDERAKSVLEFIEVINK